MVCLLRNLYNARPPINGFDQLPLHAEIFTEADFARIKTYRNKLVHACSDEIDNTYYKSSWKDITDVSICFLIKQDEPFIFFFLGKFRTF